MGAIIFTFRDGTTTNDTIEWATKYEDPEYRRVAYNKNVGPNNYVVSTIWQGMPVGPWGETRVYETMILSGGAIIQTEHAATEEEALAMHADFIDRIESMG